MKKKTPWYKLIALAVQEMHTIDRTQDTSGYPTVHWLIAEHMLKDFTKYERDRCICGYAKKIQLNFSTAVAYLRSQGINVYSWSIVGMSGSACVTLNKEYSEAYNRNYNRIRKHVHEVIKASVIQAKLAAPDAVNDLSLTTRNLLP